jgi:hypothetical protein
MSVSIDLTPNVANQLKALAERRGVSVDQLLEDLIGEIHDVPPSGQSPTEEEFERDLSAFAEGTENRNDENESDYSRKDIYFDHD